MNQMKSPQEEKKIQVADSSAYPIIQVTEPNGKYARMLKVDLASSKSELTSILQYQYQSWILGEKFSEIALTMHRIALVEMHHLDIFARLIVLLGGDPEYSGVYRNRVYRWSSDMISYQKRVTHIMKTNLVMERGAIDFYEKQCQVIKDPHIVAILQRIILDEKIHIKIFEKFLREKSFD